MSDEFSDYDRRHLFQREFTRVFRKHEDADPDELARGCIEALFDHLLNPPALDRLEGPFEEEACQVKAKLLDFIANEASGVRELIRGHKRPKS